MDSKADSFPGLRYSAGAMSQPPSPSARKLIGVTLVLLLIVFWAAFVAMLAPLVTPWPILIQAHIISLWEPSGSSH